MQILATVLVLVGAIVAPFYLHAIYRFRQILRSELPSQARPGFHHEGMPSPAQPNGGTAMISAAFGPVARELKHPEAAMYARRIRLSLLTMSPTVFLGFLIMVATAP